MSDTPIPNGVKLAKCSVYCGWNLVGVGGGCHGEDVKVWLACLFACWREVSLLQLKRCFYIGTKTPYYPASWNPVLRPCPAKGCPAGRRTPNFVLSGFLLTLASCVLHTVFGVQILGSNLAYWVRYRYFLLYKKILHYRFHRFNLSTHHVCKIIVDVIV